MLNTRWLHVARDHEKYLNSLNDDVSEGFLSSENFRVELSQHCFCVEWQSPNMPCVRNANYAWKWKIRLLSTRRALLPYALYSDSALLVLNGTSLSSVNALLALNWRYLNYGATLANFLILLGNILRESWESIKDKHSLHIDKSGGGGSFFCFCFLFFGGSIFKVRSPK